MLLIARGEGQDIVTCNEGCQPTTTTEGASTDVFVAGYGVHRKGDLNTIHTFAPPVCPSHQTPLTSSSSTVFVNGKGVGRQTDKYLVELITSVTQTSVFTGSM